MFSFKNSSLIEFQFFYINFDDIYLQTPCFIIIVLAFTGLSLKRGISTLPSTKKKVYSGL